MHIFYVNGRKVTRGKAFIHWRASETYRNANRATRDGIWETAVDGDEHGNHDPHGEVNHLREAGIEIR